MASVAEPYLHLVPADVWQSANSAAEYVPEAYDVDGFIHCTIGDERMVQVANRFYTADPRQMLVLTLDPNRIVSPVRFEDPESVFPHIYGPLNRNAVIAVRPVIRAEAGRFVGIGSAS